MTFGIIFFALILTYLAFRYPLFRAIGVLVCFAVIFGILYIVWDFSYPDNLWYFWSLVGLGAGQLTLLGVLNRVIR